MGNASFTRDEVILALDILYAGDRNSFSPTSKNVIELSDLLKRLPVHPLEKKKRITFRSPTGISRQVNLFVRCCKLGEKHPNVGKMFFEVAFDYEDDHQAIHNIAAAIRRNEKAYTTLFGNVAENIGFPEGVLLGHLHRIIETKANAAYPKDTACGICGLRPSIQYSGEFNLLELHLMIPPEELDSDEKYDVTQYITVCPTCHSALHRYRPWRSKENCEDILR